jgi:DNA repair protein REV1
LKKTQFKNVKVASPQWILDSIDQNRLLPWQDYNILGIRTIKDARHPGFLEEFYKNSRLHFLSTSKTQLQDLVQSLRKDKKSNGQSTESLHKFKIIFHIDMDCFFASVSILKHPELKGKPIGISHATSAGKHAKYADLASCNYEARKFGIRNGMQYGFHFYPVFS